MFARGTPKREQPRWAHVTIALWIVAAYLALLYVAFRWGGSGPVDIPSVG